MASDKKTKVTGNEIQLLRKNTKKIEVDGNELQFMRRNAPKGFASIIVDQLKDQGYDVGRVKVHTELHSIKDFYDEHIISAARNVLKILKGLEYQDQ